jgi:hypothetical protein
MATASPTLSVALHVNISFFQKLMTMFTIETGSYIIYELSRATFIYVIWKIVHWSSHDNDGDQIKADQVDWEFKTYEWNMELETYRMEILWK